jgi:hypothetical protein
VQQASENDRLLGKSRRQNKKASLPLLTDAVEKGLVIFGEQ